MNLLPRSRRGWIRSTVLCTGLLAACWYRNLFSLLQLAAYEPREGDILFQSLPKGELVDAIEGVTNSPWSHCGVLMRTESGWTVIEAIGHVRETPLALWIVRGRGGRFAAFRPSDSGSFTRDGSLHEPLLKALRTYIGRPYDFRYAPGDDEIYCSELVYKAYRDAFGAEIGKWEALEQLNWQPFEPFIRSLEGGRLPLERLMVTPVGLTRSPLLSRVYPSPK
ncbi:YiiX/YebB-like N1pC/P60 family cysteine hydrolase [Verrucomicrobiota bacterium sgz303538]